MPRSVIPLLPVSKKVFVKNGEFANKIFYKSIRKLSLALPPRLLLPPDVAPFKYSQHYEEEKNSFRIKCPDHFNFTRDVIEKWAEREKHLRTSYLGLWWADDCGAEQKFSFNDLSSISKRLANGLNLVVGLKAGDKVIVILPKLYQWWLLTLAMIRAGIVVCPGTLMLSERDIQLRIEMSGACCIITDDIQADKVDAAVSAVGNNMIRQKILVPHSEDKATRPGWTSYNDLLHDDVPREHKCIDSRATDSMFLYFTSGTTGLPKMVDLSHSYALGHVSTARYWYSCRPGDVSYVVTDPGWAKILYGTFGFWLGMSAVFVHNNRLPVKNVAAENLEILKKYPINVFCAAPTLYRMFLLEKVPSRDEIPHLQQCLSAGEPNNPEVIEKWEKLTGGIRIREGYGQTETALLACNMPGMDIKPGSMGRAVPGIDLRVVDRNGKELPAMQEGHLAIKLPPGGKPVGMFSKYLGNTDAMEKAFHGDYYFTGDKCYLDSDGYIYFVGRADDVIITAGYRIGPFEIESALIEHPAVAESAAVSSPDSIKGEIVKAFVVLKQSFKNADKEALTKELQTHVKTVTAPYKYPRKIEFVDTLPKTISGKTRRVELRNREWSREDQMNAY